MKLPNYIEQTKEMIKAKIDQLLEEGVKNCFLKEISVSIFIREVYQFLFQ